jgi:hypothetical protein
VSRAVFGARDPRAGRLRRSSRAEITMNRFTLPMYSLADIKSPRCFSSD